MTLSRFTEAAWRVMDLAADDARAHGHPRVGTGHILRGLIRQEDGVAARVLASLRVTLARAGGLAEARPEREDGDPGDGRPRRSSSPRQPSG